MYNRQKLFLATLSILLILGLSVPATAIESPITEVKNSSEFEWCYEFEGDTAALLSEIDLDGNLEGDFGDYQLWGTNSVQNGAMNMAVAETGGYNVFSDFSASFYPLIDTTLWRSNGFDRASGFTIEIRLKVTSGEDEGPQGALNLIAVPSDTSAAGGIHIGSSGQYWPSDGQPIGAQEDNTDDFHTFRIALETNPIIHLEKYSIWRDGFLITTGQAWGTGRSGMLSLGQADSQIWGSVDIDYLRIDHGSWAPWAPLGIPGDANLDEVVDADDAAILAGNWLASVGTWAGGDFNGDGVVDQLDATLLAANWQTAAASSSVPEPTSLILMLSILSTAAFYRRAR